MYFKDERKFEILKCIEENKNCTFGKIQSHLKERRLEYANNKGLDKALKTLENKERKIKKDSNPKNSKYPTYSVVNDSLFITAMNGELFREHASRLFTHAHKVDEGYFKNEIDTDELESFEEKFIKEMVYRYGFFMLSALVKSYEQKYKQKGFDRKIWFDHAIDLLKDEEMLSNPFLGLLVKEELKKSKRVSNTKVKKKLITLKQTMKDKYPKLYGMALGHYENSIENQPEKIKRLKKYPDVTKNIKF